MLFFRFSVKVIVSGAQGSNADIAIDDFAIGAACFDTGTRWPTSNDLFKFEILNVHVAVDQNLMTPIVVKSLAIKLSAQRENPMVLFVSN